MPGSRVAVRRHGFSDNTHGVLVSRRSGAFHPNWPALTRHDSGLSLSVYPLVMDEPEKEREPVCCSTRPRAIRIWSKPGTMVGRPTMTKGLLQRLQAGERSVFEVDAETLMRLRLREFDSENTASFVTHENAAHRMGV